MAILLCKLDRGQHKAGPRAFLDTFRRHGRRLVEIGDGRGRGSTGDVDVEFEVAANLTGLYGVLLFYCTFCVPPRYAMRVGG